MAGRWDCASECKLTLTFSDGHEWHCQRSFTNGDNQWHRITYRYMTYASNQMPSRVSIHLKGKDRQYWAGHYGTKFAQIKLRLVLREENQREDQELEEILTPPEQLHLEQSS